METTKNDQQEENRQIIKTDVERKRPPAVAKKPKPPIAKKPPIAQKPPHLVRSPSSLDDKENSVSTSPRVPPPLPRTPPKGPGRISNHISPNSTLLISKSPAENCVDDSSVKTTQTLKQKTPPVPPKKSINKNSNLSCIHGKDDASSQSQQSFTTTGSESVSITPFNRSVTQQPPTPPKRNLNNNQVTENAETKSDILRNSSVQKVEKVKNEPVVNGEIQNECNSINDDVRVEEKHLKEPDLKCSGEGHTNEETSENEHYKGPQRFNPFNKETSVEGQSENDCENTASCEEDLKKMQNHGGNSSYDVNSKNVVLDVQKQEKHLWNKKDKTSNSGKKLQNSAEHLPEIHSQNEKSSQGVLSKITEQMFLHKNGDIPSNKKSISKSHENVSSTGNTDHKHKHKVWTSFFKNKLTRHEDVKSEQTFISYIDEQNQNVNSCSDSTVINNVTYPSHNINVIDNDEDQHSVSSYGSCADKSQQLNNELHDIFQSNSSFHNNVSESEEYRRNSLPNYSTRRESCSPVNQSKSVPNKPQPVPRKISPNRPRPVPRKRLSLSRQGSQTSISEISTTDSDMGVTVNSVKETENEPNNENSKTSDLETSESLNDNIEPGVKTDKIKNCDVHILNVNENKSGSFDNDMTSKLIVDNSSTQDITVNISDKDYVQLAENEGQNIKSNLTPNKDFVQLTENKNQVSVSQFKTVHISKETNIQKKSENEKLRFSCGKNKDLNSNFIKNENSCTSHKEIASDLGKFQLSDKEKEQHDLCQTDISEFKRERAKNEQDSKSKSSNLRDVPKAQSFDASLLSGEPLMETSSLLDEIEQLVSRRLSKLGPEFAYEFSKNSDPVPPPRPKRDDRRRSSQVSSTGFDEHSSELDKNLFKGSNTSLDINNDHHVIPPAVSKKQCPPKPKRTKLINRSHSDVSGMKQLSLFKQDDPEINTQTSDINQSEDSVQNGDKSNPLPLPPRRLRSLTVDFCVPANQAALIKQIEINDSKSTSETGSQNDIDIAKSDRIKKLRPTRRAPPPPVQAGGNSQNKKYDNGYQDIKGEEDGKCYSVNHDYHEIPDNIGQQMENCGSNLSLNHESAQHKDKSPSPPDLPPRNYNQSPPRHSFLDNRPLSMASLISSSSNSGSLGSPEQDELTSSDSDGEDDEEKLKKKKEKKVFFIANEIVSSEKVFVDVLKLLNQDFRLHISQTTESLQRIVISNDILNKILNYLPQLQNFNEDLLHDLEERISHWEEHKKVADIFVKKGPFLKLYTSYIKDFEEMTLTLDEACKKNPAFHSAVKAFEASPRCANLGLKHYMLKPIQRIPQYKLLLKDYRKHLSPSSPDYEDTNSALNIVSEVADHANESMRHGDQVHKLLEIQRSLDGNFEVIKPGRILMKQGELMKLSRKEMQPRFFFLFNDVLLYTTPMATGGYRLNNALTLAGMKATKANLDEFKNEFNIISVQRSFTVEARTPEERDEWLEALNNAIDENAQRRGTFDSVKAGMQTSYLDKDFVLGSKAPIWVPDTRVTMCMNCTGEFTVTWRRHHCRACGRVVCANCSDNRAPLEYLRNKPARVCDDCFEKLHEDFEKKAGGSSVEVVPDNIDQDGSLLSFSSLKERFQKIRRSTRLGHKFSVHRPSRLREVHASDQGSSMSGNLKMLKGRKWKKFWFVIKDKVLYTYKASADMAAIESMPILGYEVVRFTEPFEGVAPALLFQLNHKNRPPVIFQTDNTNSTERWVKAMKDASVA